MPAVWEKQGKGNGILRKPAGTDKHRMEITSRAIANLETGSLLMSMHHLEHK